MSLSMIILLGFISGWIFEKLKFPKIIGMLFAGIILGPFMLNIFDYKILSISSELRKLALIIILLRVGFSFRLNDIKELGKTTFFLSFIPAFFEIMAYTIFAPMLFTITRMEAVIMGTVLSAVSPAVVVPRMIYYIENKWGTKKFIPHLIMAGASFDDIFVITLFTVFIGMSTNIKNINIISFFNLPISIILGVGLGIFSGYILYLFFENLYNNGNYIKNSTKIFIVIGLSLLLVSMEEKLQNILSISSLLAVISMACMLKIKSSEFVSCRLSQKLGKIWIGAEMVLFVLVGASVDIRYTLEAGINSVIIIFIGIIVRSLGVLVSIFNTKFNFKEKIFCIVSYFPKATVQAAIGTIPLTLGLPSGKIILSVAVMAILITAPLGAFIMDYSYQKLLEKDEEYI